MDLVDLIARDRVAIDLKVTSKKQLVQEMTKMLLESDGLADSGLKTRDIVGAAMERERLGSTGVGSGVALPHARIEGLERVFVAVARLETPIEFEAIDERPVDLAAFIIAPSHAGSDHLRALSLISRRLRKEEVRAKLRTAPNSESLYTTLIDEARATAA